MNTTDNIRNFRVINAGSREVLADAIGTIGEAMSRANESESHETQPEVKSQELRDGEWVRVAG